MYLSARFFILSCICIVLTISTMQATDKALVRAAHHITGYSRVAILEIDLAYKKDYYLEDEDFTHSLDIIQTIEHTLKQQQKSYYILYPYSAYYLSNNYAYFAFTIIPNDYNYKLDNSKAPTYNFTPYDFRIKEAKSYTIENILLYSQQDIK